MLYAARSLVGFLYQVSAGESESREKQESEAERKHDIVELNR